MDERERLIEQTVDQAKGLAKVGAQLAVKEAGAVVEPALPSLRMAGLALAMAMGGMVFLLLPTALRLARRPVVSRLAGGVLLGLAFVNASRALAALPPDLPERLRRLVRDDLTTAAEATASPSPSPGATH